MLFVGVDLGTSAVKLLLMDENGKFHLSKSNPLVYSHGGYYETGKEIGSFGYSVRKKKRKKKKRKGTS